MHSCQERHYHYPYHYHRTIINHHHTRPMVEAADRVGVEVMEPIMADPMEPQGWVFYYILFLYLVYILFYICFMYLFYIFGFVFIWFDCGGSNGATRLRFASTLIFRFWCVCVFVGFCKPFQFVLPQSLFSCCIFQKYFSSKLSKCANCANCQNCDPEQQLPWHWKVLANFTIPGTEVNVDFYNYLI